jgi:hypothetical protein
MADQHPITPPPELRKLWAQQAQRLTPHDITGWLDYVATQAARWGADQELQACINFVYDNELCDPNFYNNLRTARRPKPPSLKEQALEVLSLTQKGFGLAQVDLDTIRTALEALPND